MKDEYSKRDGIVAGVMAHETCLLINLIAFDLLAKQIYKLVRKIVAFLYTEKLLISLRYFHCKNNEGESCVLYS